jgi:hypothetical protein
MKPDVYTKAVLTVIALLLAVIAFKPLISPETTASAQGQFAGVQFNGGLASDDIGFFDPRSGEIWGYSGGELWSKRRLTKLGQPLAVEFQHK